MYLKTPIKLLLKRYGILSVDIRRAIQAETPPEEQEPEAPETQGGNGNGKDHEADASSSAIGALKDPPVEPEIAQTAEDSSIRAESLSASRALKDEQSKKDKDALGW
jgi:recombinational DNA repair protein RecT